MVRVVTAEVSCATALAWYRKIEENKYPDELLDALAG